MEVDSPESGPDARRVETRIAALAIGSFSVCLFGPLLALWWASRHESGLVKRYAVTSLAFQGVVLAGGLVSALTIVLLPALVALATFWLLWMLEVGLVAFSLVLAVGAWRGRDVGDRLPRILADRLPRFPDAPA